MAAAVGAGSWRFLLVALVIAALMAIPPAAIGADVAGARVIYSTETQYQYARVLQFASGERWLQLNEGVAVHSLYRPGSYLTGGYWDDFLVLPFAGARAAPPAASRSSATRRARWRGPTATTSRTRASTRSRSTAS